MNKVGLILILVVTLFQVGVVSAQTPDEIRFDCKPSQVTVFQDSVWIRCEVSPSQDPEANVWGAPLSSAGANSHLDMALKGMDSQLRFQITYKATDPVDSICNKDFASNCRLIRWTNISP